MPLIARAVAALGLDLGTQGVKGLLLDAGGTVIASASQSYPIHAPRPGWAEQDPADWWRAVCSVVRRLLTDTQAQIVAVGLSGQMHGAVLVDDTGTPVRPCMLWADARAATESEDIPSLVPGITLITGNPVMTAFTAPKLRWLQRHEPDAFARAVRLLLPKDYVRFRLTGRMATDPTDASGTLLFDLGGWRWSSDVITPLAIPPTLLPELVPTMEVAGAVTAKAEQATGLRAGTPVIAGGADMALGLVGCGITAPGIASVLISTAGQVLVLVPGIAEEGLGRIYHLAYVAPRTYYAMGAILSAGICLRWIGAVTGLVPGAEAPAEGDVYERLTACAATAPPGARGVLFLPYLLGTGTPHMDPHATGTLVGLTLSHGPEDLIRAVMEGVAYGLRDSVETLRLGGVRITGIRLGGGGARSSLWRQIVADVFNAPVSPLEIPDASPLGAAILAAVRGGMMENLEAAAAQVARLGPPTYPDADRADRYEEGFRRYRDLYPALRETYRTRSSPQLLPGNEAPHRD